MGSPRTMVSKLVACLLIIPAAVIWAAGPHAAVHPAPYAPVHPAPYAPAHPAPYAPAHHGYCDPKAPPKCAEGSDLPYCIVDKEYPAYDIAVKISQDALFLKKYADIADQSADDLVELITKPQEEHFDYHYYTGASKGPSKYDASHWIGPEGYLCPSDPYRGFFIDTYKLPSACSCHIPA